MDWDTCEHMLAEKERILYEMNKEKLEVMENGVSRKIFKDGIGFDAVCKERGCVVVVDGSIMWLAQPDK